jgi:hypothetical protein
MNLNQDTKKRLIIGLSIALSIEVIGWGALWCNGPISRGGAASMTCFATSLFALGAVCVTLFMPND